MLFSIGCRKGSEQQLVLNILNKAMHCISQPTKFPYKCTISSAFSIPSNYPGVIFVEAPGEAQVRESLETFTDINLKRIKPESKIIYNVLFRNKSNRRSDFTEKQMVRIKSGVYKGDLGKIVKILNNRVKLLVVPRVDLKKMNNLML